MGVEFFSGLSTTILLAAFALAGGVILIVSLRLTALADSIADRTGLGEALVGAMLLGAATSLSGLVVSFTAASSGDAPLAFSNSIGGIAAQTAFLAVADLVHRRANLEHAAAEPTNLFQSALLLSMLSLPLIAHSGPQFSVLGVHPISVILVLSYLVGMRFSAHVRDSPMWVPRETAATRRDEPEDAQEKHRSPVAQIVTFVLLMGILGCAGWVIAQIAGVLIARFGLSASVVGALGTAVITSLPELVTTIAAVRRGALQLAVGGIIGGNTFDILFLSVADIGYRDGSLYHAIGPDDLFWLATGMLMTAVLLMGLLMRQRGGPAGIGVESITMLVIYAVAIAMAVAL